MSDDTVAFIDRHENVLLIVGISARKPAELGRTITWFPSRRDGDHLVMINLIDRHEQRIEWRRDCLIHLDDAGNPTYRSCSVTEFRSAIRDPQRWKERPNDLIAKYAP